MTETVERIAAAVHRELSAAAFVAGADLTLGRDRAWHIGWSDLPPAYRDVFRAVVAALIAHRYIEPAADE